MRLDINIRQADGLGSSWRDESNSSAHIFVSKNINIELTKRHSYPKTFARIHNEQLLAGYAGPKVAELVNGGKVLNYQTLADRLDDEFLVIECDLKDGSFRLSRDAITTLPLFWADTARQQVITSSFSSLFQTLQAADLTLDYRNLTELLYLFDINQRTLFKEIKMLTERSTLHINRGRAKLGLPTDAQLPKVDPQSPKHFKLVLEEILDEYASKVGSNAVFELSGGIDSALMPGYLADIGELEPVTTTMLFPGDYQLTQKEKIAKFHERFGGKNLTYAIRAADYPFSRFKNHLPQLPPYQFQEIYTEALARTADLVAKHGAPVVFTGMGGDELFENVDFERESHEGQAEIVRRRKARIPVIYQPVLKDLLKLTLEDMVPIRATPIPLAGRSALFGGYSRNNVYLEMGLWPVSPLADWRLFQFCQSLPIKFRANKNILRAYQQARRYPQAIYQPKINENFGQYFDRSIAKRFRPLLEAVLEDSFLAGLGLVARDTVLRRYETLASADTKAQSISFFTMATAEIILQSVRNLGHRIKT